MRRGALLIGLLIVGLFVLSIACPKPTPTPTPTPTPKVTPTPVVTPTPPVDLVAKGEELYVKKACGGCHGSKGEGVPGVAPPVKGIFGTTIELADGSKRTADEEYLRWTLTNPDATPLKGYLRTMMKSQLTTIKLTSEEVEALIAYIKSLK